MRHMRVSLCPLVRGAPPMTALGELRCATRRCFCCGFGAVTRAVGGEAGRRFYLLFSLGEGVGLSGCGVCVWCGVAVSGGWRGSLGRVVGWLVEWGVLAWLVEYFTWGFLEGLEEEYVGGIGIGVGGVC
jgi:hypothetical protein